MKKFIYPLLPVFIIRLLKNIKNRRFINNSPENIFTYIYKKNMWKNKESISGEGSTIGAAENLIHYLPLLFKKYNIQSVLDIPCGDFNWMKKVNLSSIQYIGADIVKEIIDKNKKYETPSLSFKKLNIIDSELPKTNLLICRDCFVHFPNDIILQSLENIKKQKIKLLLTTSFPNTKENKNILMGEWRPINLEIAPFNYKPIDVFFENDKKDKALLLLQLN